LHDGIVHIFVYDVDDVQKINECSGSGGYSNTGNFTLPLAHHMPAVSPGNLDSYNIDISPSFHQQDHIYCNPFHCRNKMQQIPWLVHDAKFVTFVLMLDLLTDLQMEFDVRFVLVEQHFIVIAPLHFEIYYETIGTVY
jgi:hypothetical protein